MRSCVVTLVIFGLLSGGCASSTRLQIQSADKTNDGRSLYMLVRPVEDEDVVAEPYEAATRRVFARQAVPDGQERHVIIPGQTMTIDLATERKQDVVLYFFFTQPGDRWWLALDKKRLSGEIVVELGINEVERIRVRGR